MSISVSQNPFELKSSISFSPETSSNNDPTELWFTHSPAILATPPTTHFCCLLSLGFSRILRLVLKELDVFYRRDLAGLQLLYDLLQTPWLQALLKVSPSLVMNLGAESGHTLDLGSGRESHLQG